LQNTPKYSWSLLSTSRKGSTSFQSLTVRLGEHFQCIDLDVIDGDGCYACGVRMYRPFCLSNTHTTFFQEIITDSGMENVREVSTRGLELIKESLIILCWTVSASPDDISLLQDAAITFTLSWANLITQFNHAVEKTTHHRYISWFQKSFRGAKCRLDDDHEHGSSGTGTTLSCSMRLRTRS